MSTYPRTYALLKRAGHSPIKALEIVISASRGEEHALIWLGIIFKARHRWVS